MDTKQLPVQEKIFLLAFILILLIYGVVSIEYLFLSTFTHDETIYVVKSWWLVSGKKDWYSDELPLWYLPNAYLVPGISQWILGKGILEARLPGLIFAILTFICVFTYAQREFGTLYALTCVAVLGTSFAVYRWSGPVSQNAISSLAIVLVFISSSNRFISSQTLRILLPSLFFTLLIFTRLNHLVSLLLLLPVIALGQLKNPFKTTLATLLFTAVATAITIKALPDTFDRTNTLGLLPKLSNVLNSNRISDHKFSHDFAAATGFKHADELHHAYNSVGHSSVIPFNYKKLGPIDRLKIDLGLASESLKHTWKFLALHFGTIFVGILLLWIGLFFGLSAPSIMIWCSVAFPAYIFVSYLKGYQFCGSCPVQYSSYFLIPGVLAGGTGFWMILRHLRSNILIASVAVISVIAMAFFGHSKIRAWGVHEKNDLQEFANQIERLVPAEEEILTLGVLGYPTPLRIGPYLANRQIEPRQLNANFSLLDVSLEIPITEHDRKLVLQKGFWTSHHLVRWLEDTYNYVLKPRSLFYDDQKNKYWFRNLYYTAEARDLLARRFDCSVIDGSYKTIPPIELCVRKSS